MSGKRAREATILPVPAAVGFMPGRKDFFGKRWFVGI